MSPSRKVRRPFSSNVSSTLGGFIIAAILVVVTGLRVSAAEPDLTKTLEQFDRGIVLINCQNKNGEDAQLGTGFVIDARGLVATCYHVLRGASSATATFADGTKVAVKGVRAWDAPGDLAIVELAELPKNLAVLQLKRDLERRVGSEVIAIGNPYGFKFTPSLGIISGVHTTAELPPPFSEWIGAPETNVWLQTSAPIDGGNSGGPLMSRNGEVYGVITWATGSGGKLGFASDVRHLVALRDQLGTTSVPLAELTGPEAELRELAMEFGSQRFWFPSLRTGAKAKKERSPTEDYVPRVWEFAQKYQGKPAESLALRMLWNMVSDPKCATNCGPVVAQAAARTVAAFGNSPEFVYPVLGLESTELKEAREFLQTIGEKTQNQRMRAAAWLALALSLDGDGKHAARADDALKWAERVSKELPDVKLRGAKMSRTAGDLSFKLKNLVVGRTAPDIAGADEEGHAIKLSDYRGKAVLVAFWSDRFPQCRDFYATARKLVSMYEGRPFMLLGVNGDTQTQLAKLRSGKEVTWTNLMDGAKGPITTAWQVDSFPRFFMINDKGIINNWDVQEEALESVVARNIKMVDKGIITAGTNGVISLRPHRGELHGSPIAIAERDNTFVIINWNNAANTVSWQVNFPEAGQYRVSATYSATAQQQFGLGVETEDQHALVSMKSTGGFRTYVEAGGGVIKVAKAGVLTVTAKPNNAKRWKTISLKEIKLEPVK